MKAVKHLLKKIELARKEIAHENNQVENAKFRLAQTPNDPTWERIKKAHEDRLQIANYTFETLHQTLYSLKEYLEPSDWQTVLENFGYILADTENINHVSDSLSDERDLQVALTETENAIKFIQERLAVANGDIKVILEAQLEYYASDMKSHFWGEERLQSILNKETPKR